MWQLTWSLTTWVVHFTLKALRYRGSSFTNRFLSFTGPWWSCSASGTWDTHPARHVQTLHTQRSLRLTESQTTAMKSVSAICILKYKYTEQIKEQWILQTLLSLCKSQALASKKWTWMRAVPVCFAYPLGFLDPPQISKQNAVETGASQLAGEELEGVD